MFDLIARGGAVSAALSVTLLAAGCSFIDDFDEFSFSDAGADTSGTDTPGTDTPGTDTPGTDTSGVEPVCDGACLADAWLGFSMSQGSGPLSWRYQGQDVSDAAGLTYFDLVRGNHLGLTGWVSDTPPPAIIQCEEGFSAPCQSAYELLLQASETSDAVLLTRVESAGRFNIEVTTNHADGDAELWVSRNSRSDVLAVVPLAADDGSKSVTVPMEAVANDRIVVSLRATGGAPVVVGAQVRVSSSASSSTCELTLDFDGTNTSDVCNGAELTAEGPGEPPESGAGPAPFYNQARQFLDGGEGSNYRASGVTVSRVGDFTAQMWIFIDYDNYIVTSIYQDFSGVDNTGINISLAGSDDDEELEVDFLYNDPTYTDFPSVTCEVDNGCDGLFRVPAPSTDQWVHVRVSRADNRVYLCLNGVEVASTEVQADVDISSGFDPKINFNFGGTPEHRFVGRLDDIRMLTEASACAPPR